MIHGASVIKNSLLAIGQLSEEAAEANNKNVKQFRLSYTRKMSREITNKDLFNRLLLQLDPFISNLRESPKTKISELEKDVKDLLLL